MTELSDYLSSLGVSPLLVGLVMGFVLGLLVRGRGAGRPTGDTSTVTARLRTEFAGQVRITIEVNGVPRELDASTSAAIMDAIEHRRKIDAIKLLRAATALGLKDSKEAVEALQRAAAGRPE